MAKSIDPLILVSGKLSHNGKEVKGKVFSFFSKLKPLGSVCVCVFPYAIELLLASMALIPLSGRQVGLKALSETYGRTFLLISPLFPILFVAWWGREGNVLFGRSWVGDRHLYSAFPRFYNLSSLTKILISYFLVWLGSSTSFSFGFRRLLTNNKTTTVVSIR